MARPGYESDRVVLMLRNLENGETRKLTDEWDRSVGSIAWAADGKSLLVTAPDVLDQPLFRLDATTAQAARMKDKHDQHNGNICRFPPPAHSRPLSASKTP